LLDLDPQGSLSGTWQRRAADYPVEVIHNPDISIKDPVFNSTASILIDAAPNDPQAVRLCLAVSNIALVPVKASPYDINSSLPILEMAKEARAVNPGLKLLWVFNQIKANTLIYAGIRELAKKRGLPLAKVFIPESVVLVESIAKGLPLCYMLRNHQINQSYKILLKEIINL
jgi:cellulose biosynthesis protein BcsQ